MFTKNYYLVVGSLFLPSQDALHEIICGEFQRSMQSEYRKLSYC